MNKTLDIHKYEINYKNGKIFLLSSIYLGSNKNNYFNFNFNFINEKQYTIPNNFKLPLKMNIKIK